MTSTPNNRLADYRKKAALSQRALAEKAGVSQPTVQRAEANPEPPSWQVAQALCLALELPVRVVFPGLATLTMGALDAMRAGGTQEAVDAQVESAVVLRIATFEEDRSYPITNHDKKRLLGFLNREPEGFFVFHSLGRGIVVRADMIQMVTAGELPEEDGVAPNGTNVRVWFSGDKAPLLLSPPADEDDAMTDEHLDGDYPLQTLLAQMDSEDPGFVTISNCPDGDDDGEDDVTINMAHVVLVEFDQMLIDPRFRDVYFEGLDEDAQATGSTH